MSITKEQSIENLAVNEKPVEEQSFDILATTEAPFAIPETEMKVTSEDAQTNYNIGMRFFNISFLYRTICPTAADRIPGEAWEDTCERVRLSVAAKDANTALLFLKAAAEKGHDDAQTNLATLLLKGHVKEDPQQAEFWLRKSAEKGNAQSQYNLGMMLLFGDGIQQNAQEAYHWFQKSYKKAPSWTISGLLEEAQREILVKNLVKTMYSEHADWFTGFDTEVSSLLKLELKI